MRYTAARTVISWHMTSLSSFETACTVVVRVRACVRACVHVCVRVIRLEKKKRELDMCYSSPPSSSAISVENITHFPRSRAALTRSSYPIHVHSLMFVIRPVIGRPVVMFPSSGPSMQQKRPECYHKAVYISRYCYVF